MAKVIVFENEEFDNLRAKLVSIAHKDFKNGVGFKCSTEYLMALNKMEIKVNDIIKGE